MQGLHLTTNLHPCRCAPQRRLDAARLGPTHLQAVRVCGLRPVQQLFPAFPATRLGAGSAALDVSVCSFGASPPAGARASIEALPTLFDATHVIASALQRGKGFTTASKRSTP
jgi:S-adenosylmethionine decarboxylase